MLVNSAGIVMDGLLGAMTAAAVDRRAGHQPDRHVQLLPRRHPADDDGAGSGSIVNLSSTAAEFASRGQVNYAASKGGHQRTDPRLAKEVGARGRSASTPSLPA